VTRAHPVLDRRAALATITTITMIMTLAVGHPSTIARRSAVAHRTMVDHRLAVAPPVLGKASSLIK
jgi:hypothetical protein